MTKEGKYVPYSRFGEIIPYDIDSSGLHQDTSRRAADHVGGGHVCRQKICEATLRQSIRFGRGTTS